MYSTAKGPVPGSSKDMQNGTLPSLPAAPVIQPAGSPGVGPAIMSALPMLPGSAAETPDTASGTETRSRAGNQANARSTRRHTLSSIFSKRGPAAGVEEADVDDVAATDALHGRLPQILADTQHPEMFGVPLQAPNMGTVSEVPTRIVLNKFLRANDNNVDRADAQLRSALLWRRVMQPLALADAVFSRETFENLGSITAHDTNTDGREVLVTWNRYGAVRNAKAVSRDIPEFIRYRIALMEIGIRRLGINHASHMPDGGRDPYKMIQIHDYQGVKMLLLDSATRNATRETIRVFAANYPELMSNQFLVNIPVFIPLILTVVQGVIHSTTKKKLVTLRRGSRLAENLPELGDMLPVEYGGRGESVKGGATVRLTDEGGSDQKAEKTAATTTAAASGPSGAAPNRSAPAVAGGPSEGAEDNISEKMGQISKELGMVAAAAPLTENGPNQSIGQHDGPSDTPAAPPGSGGGCEAFARGKRQGDILSGLAAPHTTTLCGLPPRHEVM